MIAIADTGFVVACYTEATKITEPPLLYTNDCKGLIYPKQL